MAFLLGIFAALRLLLDMGSSSAFYTFLSQRPRSRRFIVWYLAWQALQLALPFGLIAVCLPAEWITQIWQGESRTLVLMALMAAFTQGSLWQTVIQMGEARRETVRVQLAGVGLAGVHLVAIWFLKLTGMLSLSVVFALIAVEFLVASVAVGRYFVQAPADTKEDTPTVLWRQYVAYCMPLVPYAWLGFISEFADRWLLQNHGGAIEQAYYTVGKEFSLVALLATGSILNIFWKEIAEAHHQGNYERMSELYRKVSRTLYFIGAAIAGYLIPCSADMLLLLQGPAYTEGAITVTIMFLYPLQQSLGQVGSAMLMATERISLYVRIGMYSAVASIIATYFVLTPTDATVPGLGWGSEGLALKIVVTQAVAVNVMAWLIARIWNWRFDWHHQPASLLLCLGVGWLAHAFVNAMLPAAETVGTLALAGVVYSFLLAFSVYALPTLVGLTRAEVSTMAQTTLRRVIAK